MILKCLKCLLLIPIEIISILLAFVFLLLWIVLLPVKCCCPGGAIVGWAERFLEQMVRLPIHAAKCVLQD